MFSTGQSFRIFCYIFLLAIQVFLIIAAYKIFVLRKIKKSIVPKYSFQFQIVGLFFLTCFPVLLPITTDILAYSTKAAISQENYLQYKSINPGLLETSAEIYLVMGSSVLIFLELLAIGIMTTFFCLDQSIRRASVWTNTNPFSRVLELLFGVYIQCEYMLNNSVFKQINQFCIRITASA